MKTPDDFVATLNILDGVITYNDFDIDENLPFEKQEYSFKEDILQIKFGDRFTLDVGWYPEMNPKGFFTVYGIVDCDWEDPIAKIRCKNLKTLKKAIEKVARIINEQRKQNIPLRNIEC
jgi:hypothetical protein